MNTDCKEIDWLFFPPKRLRIVLFSDSAISDQGFLVSNMKKSLISLRNNFLSFNKLAILKVLKLEKDKSPKMPTVLGENS